MASFWHWFIAIGTILFVIWCGWIVAWSSKQGPPNVSDDELVGHKWDGDLEEWNNPAPRWWLYLYFITIIWAVGYLIAYPGLGNYQGVLGWSQKGQYEEQMAAAEERYQPIYERFAAMPWEERIAHPEAIELGASLYASYCTTCHGSDARGAKGYPNLTDSEWQWGSNEQQIVTSILDGRRAAMPVLTSALGGEEGVDAMVTYVRSLSGLTEADAAAQAAQAKYRALCSSCHGPDGKGNPALGAPNLANDIWLYGSSPEVVRRTIVNGRNGVMPAHGELLGEERTKILAAYVYSLSQ